MKVDLSNFSETDLLAFLRQVKSEVRMAEREKVNRKKTRLARHEALLVELKEKAGSFLAVNFKNEARFCELVRVTSKRFTVKIDGRNRSIHPANFIGIESVQ